MKGTCVLYRTDRIGDFICTIPAIYAVRRMLPNYHIVLVSSPMLSSIASKLPCIDEYIIYNEENPFPFSDNIEYCILFNQQKDEFYKSIEGISIKYKLGAWKSLSLMNKLRFFSFKERTETQKMLHYVKEINAKLYRSYSSFLPENPIPYPNEKKEFIKEIITPYIKKNQKIIVLSPIKEGASKVVAESFYPLIINTIHTRFPHVVILVTVSESDKKRGEAIMSSLPQNLDRCILFVSDSDLATLVALIDMCDIFIGSSSGPTHIAGLLNKKVIALYPYNRGHSPSRWGVQGNNVRYILSEKHVDELALDHPKRFGRHHLETLCSYIREFCI